MRRLEDLWKEDSTREKEKELKAAEKCDESDSTERSAGLGEDTEAVANAFAATKNLARTTVDQRKKQEEKDKAVDKMVEEAVRAFMAEGKRNDTQKWTEVDGWLEQVSDEEEGKDEGDQAKLPPGGDGEGLTGGTDKEESDEEGGGKTQEIGAGDSQETIVTEKGETTPSKGPGAGGRSRSPSEEGAGGLMGRLEKRMGE